MNKDRYMMFFDGKHLAFYDRLTMTVQKIFNTFSFSKNELMHW